MPVTELQALLNRRFPSTHAAACVKHYQGMTQEFQQSSWEGSILKSGKFVEAALKAIWLHAGQSLPPARSLKVGAIIRGLGNLPATTLGDPLRLTIPRACEFVYDVASNRGARHDPSEVDPNETDAAATMALCSWILAEMLRYAQGGAAGSAKVTSLLSGLSQRKYPLVEEVDGRVYFHLSKPSARKVGLLALWYRHPKRLTKDEIIETIKRHHFTDSNARQGVTRLRDVVDEDPKGFRLLNPGVKEAEALIGDDLSISAAR